MHDESGPSEPPTTEPSGTLVELLTRKIVGQPAALQ